MDNDISQWNVEEISFQRTNESQSGEREQSTRDIIEEETGNRWLRQASKNKARSRTSKKINVTLEEQARITNTPVIQEDEDGQKESSTSMYLRPTTMRGIPLVSLTSSPLIRGFYVTKAEDNLPSSTLTVDFTSPYTTIDNSIEQQTETALTPDISTTEETVSLVYNNQNKSEFDDNVSDIVTDEVVTRNELELDTFSDNVNDVIKSKGGDNHEEKSFTFDSLNSENSDSAENPSTYTEPNMITISVSKSASTASTDNKREISLHNVGYNSTSLSNVYAVSPTTSTRRKIALALSKYNKASTPLWTSKRIVPRKQNRTSVSSIKGAERRIDEATSSHITTDIFKNASATSEITSTVSTIPLIVSEFAISSDVAYSTDGLQTEDAKDRTNAEATIALSTNTNSVIATTPPISKITSITNDSTVISTISDDSSVTTMPSTANESIIVVTPSSIVAVAGAPVAASDRASVTTKSTIKNAAIEIPVSTANYSVAAVPTVASTQAIANDSAITLATTSTGVEITSPVANYSTDIADMIIPATINAEVKTTSAITNYSVTAIPANASTIATDSAVTTAPAITISTGIEATSTVADPVVAISTPTNTQEIAIDPVITTTTGTEIETTIANQSAFVIPATTMTPTTSTSSSAIISSTHVTVPATSNIEDTDTVTITNMSTTTIPTIAVISTSDLNIITSANTNVPSTFAIIDTSTTSSSKTNSVISSKDSVTGTDETSPSSGLPTTLTIESTTAHFNSNVFNISNNSEVITAKSVQTTEIPTTFETSPIFTSTDISRSLSSVNSAMLSTTAFSNQTSENFVTSMTTQTPSTLFSIVTKEKSTLSAIYNESIATNTIIQTTDIYRPNSVETTSEKPTTPRIKITSEETASKTIQNRKDKTWKVDDQVGQKSSRRRVVNRTNNWIGRPVVQQTINQYSPHRDAVYRERPRGPPGYTSRVIEKNRRRRITQRRMRVNYESISSTVRPNENIVVQNITENVPYNQARDVRRRMKIVSKRIRERPEEKEIITSQETASLSQASTVTDNKNETSHREKVYRENGNVENKRKILLERIKSQYQENFRADESVNFDSVNKNLSSSFQGNLRMSKNLSEQKNKRGRTRVVLKSIRPKSEEKNPIEGARGDSNSTYKNFQDNFSTNFHANKNFSDKGSTGRRMRVLLKRVRPRSKGINSTIEETNANFIDKNLRNNLSSNLSTSENFPDEKKIGRVVLKRVRPKFEEEKAKTRETNANDDSTNENLRGASLKNFKGDTNFPIEYKTGRRMRVASKNVKPKFEENNSTSKETDSDSTDEDLRGSFSSNFYANVDLSGEREARKSTFEEKDSIAEETSAHSEFTDKDLSSNLSNREKIVTYLKYGKKEATVERLEDIEEQQTTETILAEEDTDQPSLEVSAVL